MLAAAMEVAKGWETLERRAGVQEGQDKPEPEGLKQLQWLAAGGGGGGGGGGGTVPALIAQVLRRRRMEARQRTLHEMEAFLACVCLLPAPSNSATHACRWCTAVAR
jgi:hypothetical protein